ncbi:hypothetical protein M404DRAFT_998384 [Pisolithus tinctorius Marx 270]|uniref:Uncharacterized protein n=1 Tax=Pisolithus tinctorius Marx 270 TaxID=870435 RepID=A0A0C3PG76_PISTI|nr:hypothetical protein M404DRAFT_998384 [Pisolithus tinctorius Marx 270]
MAMAEQGYPLLASPLLVLAILAYVPYAQYRIATSHSCILQLCSGRALCCRGRCFIPCLGWVARTRILWLSFMRFEALLRSIDPDRPFIFVTSKIFVQCRSPY